MLPRPVSSLSRACGLAGVLLAVIPLPVAGGTGGSEISSGDATVARVGELVFRACELEGLERRRVQCSSLAVPEDHDKPDGRHINLRVVRLTAGNREGLEAPLLALAGGPGQAASEAFLHLDRLLPDVARDRDFYLVDQRGTGGSHPQHCDPGDDMLMQVAPDATRIRDAARRCLEQFDGDPALYTTSVAIRDLEQVRESLGVRRWHLFGVSYGTRVVQHYLRRHPRSVRTATMDSVVPATEAMGPDIALRSQQALEVMLARCEADSTCHDAFPDLASGLASLLAQLGETPHTVRYENLRTGALDEMRFTRLHLIGVLRLSLYQTELLSTLPPMLYQAYAHGNFTLLARAANALIGQLDKTLSTGMHNSVVCTEDVPFFHLDAAQRAALDATYLGDLVVRALEITCDVWPRGRMDADFRTPVTVAVPTLLLSGESDPITPPAYADAVLAGLPDARHLVAPGQGHFVTPRGCLPRLVAQFILSNGEAELNSDCLDRLQAAPLFVNVNGPAP